MGEARTDVADINEGEERGGLRMEGWLLALSQALQKEPGVRCALAYDDRFQGSLLALTVLTPEGPAELRVNRQIENRRGRPTERGATLALLAPPPGPGGLATFIRVTRAVHRGISRLRNGRRRFTHRVLSLAEELQRRLPTLVNDVPAGLVPALAKLQLLMPDAQLMYGLGANYRVAPAAAGAPDAEDDDAGEGSTEGEAAGGATRTTDGAGKAAPAAATGKRRGPRFAPLAGAFVLGEEGGRAVFFFPERDGFQLVGSAAQAATAALKKAGGAQAPIDFAICNPAGQLRGAVAFGGAALAATALAAGLGGGPAEGAPHQGDAVPRLGRACDFADFCDVLDCLDVLPDVGGCDLPDCNGLDLPDCSGCDFSCDF